MEMAQAVSKSRSVAALRMPRRRALAKATKANSPPCESSRPQRSAEAKGRPNNLASVVRTAVLRPSSPKARPSTLNGADRTRATSIEKPTVTKKRPRSMPRNGATVASTWYVYRVSDSARPARNAPSVVESPMASVIADTPTAAPRTAARKASCDRDFSARPSATSKSRLPKTSTAAIAAPALSAAMASAPPMDLAATPKLAPARDDI
mmetsp:Transcript_24517/g.83831  ORF Transcript_24517/g.83831 Transcript_24517/m.83831 type:complete len:208 (-) Transcript_24517:304-927(-)